MKEIFTKRFLILIALIGFGSLAALSYFEQYSGDLHEPLAIPTLATAQAQIAKVRIPWVANEGQDDSRVAYKAQTFAGNVFVETDGSLTYALEQGAIKETLLSTKPLSPQGSSLSETKISSFIGNDESKWRSNIPTYSSISLGEAWDNISVDLNAYGTNIEKIFTVTPGGDPNDIQVQISPEAELTIQNSGELTIQTDFTYLTLTKPIAFQEIGGERIDVEVSYLVSGSSYGFTVGAHDPNYPLIIDPLLASTYIGGAANEFHNAIPHIQIGSDGSIYVAGHVDGTGFPATAGAYDETYNAGWDLFIAKLSGDLTSLSAATFFGSGANDFIGGLALDSSDNVFITSNVSTSTFPVTSGAYDETFNGGTDIAVSKFNSSLTSLSASSFLGGDTTDGYQRVYVDDSDNVWVSGATQSSDFPTTNGAYDETANGDYDLFVSKMTNDLTTLSASTLIGGSAHEYNTRLTVSSSGIPFVLAEVNSSNFPTSTDGYDTTYGGTDMVILKFNSALTTLSAATYYGGAGVDQPGDIVIDSSGIVYVSGRGASGIPVTSGAYDESHNGSNDCAIGKFSNDLTSLLASTFLGGSGGDICYDIGLDSSGYIYVTGDTTSANFPTSSVAYQATSGGGTDVFVSKFTNDLVSLLDSTYLGGSGTDRQPSLAVDSSSNVYIYVEGTSTNYPTSSGAYQETLGGGWDGMITKLSLVTPNTAPVATIGTPAHVSSSFTVSFTATISDADLDVTSLVVEHSQDNSTWASSTLSSATPDQGAVSVSSSTISGIDTDSATTTLTIIWSADSDISSALDSTVYLRVIPSDGTALGTIQTSSAFTVDTRAAATPTVFSGSVPAAGSVTLSWTGSNPTYLITNTTTAATSTSSSASTTISDLTCNQEYVFNVKGVAQDASQSAASENITIRAGSCPGGSAPRKSPATTPASAPTTSTSPSASESTTIPANLSSLPPSEQIAILQNVLESLIAQLSAMSDSFQFTRDLETGITGKDVRELQIYLNTNGFSLATDGPGSPGNETLMFGSLTRAALIKYQQSKNIQPAIGYFGPITRAAINRQAP